MIWGLVIYRSLQFINITNQWFINRALNLGINATNKFNKDYKSVCDYRPLYGLLFEDYLHSYDYFMYQTFSFVIFILEIWWHWWHLWENRLVQFDTVQFDIVSGYCRALPKKKCGKYSSFAAGPFTMIRRNYAFRDLVFRNIKWKWKSRWRHREWDF